MSKRDTRYVKHFRLPSADIIIVGGLSLCDGLRSVFVPTQ